MTSKNDLNSHLKNHTRALIELESAIYLGNLMSLNPNKNVRGWIQWQQALYRQKILNPESF
jgi:hypothetical protein